MGTNATLFSQIIGTLCRTSFKKLVGQHQTDKHNKGINNWTQLVSMLFCQFSKLSSLREISNGLRSATGNLNHLGLHKAPSKSSLSYQNKNREWKLFKDYYFIMLNKLSGMAGFKQSRFRIKSKILLLDSTVISRCLNLFDWVKYKIPKRRAVKLHALLDKNGCLFVYAIQ